MTSLARDAPAGPGSPSRQLWGRPPGYTPRSSAGLAGYERVLIRAGLSPVAGIDEAGRGACAGPLVVAAAVICPEGRVSIPGLADSKELQPAAREEVYEHLVRTAFAWHVVVIPPADIDRFGLHVCNVAGMRRALAGLRCRPGFVLTDGFPVRGLGVPSLAMWKGDQVAACVAAASILAKVTRDRIMTDLDERHPQYGFARHKGYCTPDHREALMDHGPSRSHRYSYANVVEALQVRNGALPAPAADRDGAPPAPAEDLDGGLPEPGEDLDGAPSALVADLEHILPAQAQPGDDPLSARALLATGDTGAEQPSRALASSLNASGGFQPHAERSAS